MCFEGVKKSTESLPSVFHAASTALGGILAGVVIFLAGVFLPGVSIPDWAKIAVATIIAMLAPYGDSGFSWRVRVLPPSSVVLSCMAPLYIALYIPTLPFRNT